MARPFNTMQRMSCATMAAELLRNGGTSLQRQCCGRSALAHLIRTSPAYTRSHLDQRRSLHMTHRCNAVPPPHSHRTRDASGAVTREAARRQRVFAAVALVAGGLVLAYATTESPLSVQAATSKLSKPLFCEPSRQRTLPDVSHLDPRVVEDESASMRTRMETYVKLLQHRIVQQLGAEEPATTFFVDSWLRKEGGEGISCVLQDGETFEKAGVNISIVHGMLPPRAIAQMSGDHSGLLERVGYMLGLSPNEKADVTGLPFYATGLSLVVHPSNPMVPTVHFNYRYFELTHPPKLADGSSNPRYDPAHPEKPAAWWFGGGSDLTPIYLFDADATHFHNTLKSAADQQDRHFYPVWKAWCDRYFWIPHRSEARGVGGIFFDDLTTVESAAHLQPQPIPLSPGSVKAEGVRGPQDPPLPPADLPASSALPHTRESLFGTVRALGDAFLPAYLPLLQLRKKMSYLSDDQAWQAVRRGRYVEFNLVYDRGTKFGLQTPGARIESILMSLPMHASWVYGHPYSGKDRPTKEEREQAEKHEGPGSRIYEQCRVMDVLRSPRDWATAA